MKKRKRKVKERKTGVRLNNCKHQNPEINPEILLCTLIETKF